MKKLLCIFTLLCAVAGICACSDDSHGPGHATPQAEQALLAKYPTATDISWHYKHGYYIADFLSAATRAAAPGLLERKAWFDAAGKWYMTETELPFAMLPEAVRNAFSAGEYAAWHVDDVDMIEREGAETVYVIQVEDKSAGIETEVDLYYSPDGVLVKKVADANKDYDYEDFIPALPAGAVSAYLTANYPDARILDIDFENGMTEVEILDGRTRRDLLFDAAGNWLRTKTEVTRAEVPAAVMQALAASQYATYRIDDIDHYRTPEGEFYRFELDSASGDIDIDIAPDGTITVVSADSDVPGGGNQQMLDKTVREFIAKKYPGATVREFDYDDGLLEVEIVHEGRAKEVYFNGAGSWVKTEWDVRRNELPAPVASAVAASQYASWKIDDIEYVQTPSAEYYLIELEQGSSEVRLRITASGEIL